MANRTVKDASTVKGTNPQYLVEKIIRTRIYDSKYWKEECFALTAELLVDKGMELRYVGGIYAGNVKPTPFLCLCLKMLQIQPEKDIVVEFISQEEYKYIRALGAMYLRLTFSSIEVYKYLEPLYNDYRKLRYMDKTGHFELVHMDEFIDHLLRDERYCDIQLPRLQKREALESIGELQPYVSALDEDLTKLSSSESESDSEEERMRRKRERPKLVSRRRSRDRDRDRDRERDRERVKDKDRRHRSPDYRERDRDDRKERDRDKDKDRDRRDSRRRKDDDEREIEEANALRKKLGMDPLQK
uniref:Pre-mRNA-splicing factor 38 n=1 Tax=Syphacia muris TaxID=451379 RepID=A0A0N5AFH1_9BILA